MMSVVCTILALVCGVTAILDMMMNGADTAWAPYGLVGALAFGATAAWLTSLGW